MKAPVSAVLSVCAMVGMCATRVTHAEDIDIFAGGGVSSDRPNVILVLDSSANWSSSIPVPECYYKENGVLTTNGPRANSPNKEQGTKMGIEKCALYNLVDALPVASDGSAEFNVGLMLFNESPAALSGGYPRRALLALTAENKTALKSAIAGLGINADKGNNAAFSKSLYEAFLYLRGATPYRGTAGSKWDHAATVDGLATGAYMSSANSGCARSHIIFIANGSPGEVTDSDAKELLAAAGGDTAPISYVTSYVTNSDQANWADEFARFMSSTDVSSMDGTQDIVTHAVAVTGASSDGLYPNFIRGIAAAGGGHYAEASDPESLTRELLKIFVDIQAVSSVFSAASLPISVNASGTYLNRIYMGMFVPDPNARPRWDGNLKQYQFEYDQATDTLSLVDRNRDPAISTSTGFITPTASSFWTHDSSFWINNPSGSPLSVSDDPDGAVVSKGAAAQVLRETHASSQSTRKVFTCLSCGSGTILGSNAATLFATGNTGITSAHLNVSDAERDALINWIRGTDNKGDEAGPGGTTTVRPSIHGDALHSRPAAINYGGSRGIVVFYGSNDGMLHALNGEQTGVGAGSELWSFVPSEMLSRLNRLRNNSPIIAFPSIPTGITPTPTRRDYFVDGPISFYERFNTSGVADKVYLYVAMRRGGRVLYAFDVTDPAMPKYLWKVASADVPELGYTWSEARIAKIRGNPNPVLVMGGGYDPLAEDVTPAGTVTMGNAVVVLDAFTGEPLRTFTGIDRPVPADVALVDSDFDGYVDRAYAVDLGGTIYRIDFESGDATSRSDWTIARLAELGSSGGKKFFYAPDVVITKKYTAVLVGSGDREKPLMDTSSDYFYTVMDPILGKTVPADFTSTKFADLAANPVETGVSGDIKGCYLALDTAGEKVVTSAMTIGGKTYFSTNMPSPPAPNTCAADLGIARTYSMPLMCRTPEVVVLNGGGLPPSPVGGIVEVPYTNPDGSVVMREQPFIIGGGAKSSPIEVEKVKIPVSPRRTRRYWYYESAQ